MMETTWYEVNIGNLAYKYNHNEIHPVMEGIKAHAKATGAKISTEKIGGVYVITIIQE